MARSVADTALLLEAMAGFDAQDPISKIWIPGAATKAAATPLLPPRIAFSQGLGIFSCSRAIEDVFQRAIKQLTGAGGQLQEGSPDFSKAQWIGDTIRRARMARMIDLKGEMSEHLRAEVESGLRISVLELAQAEAARAEMFYQCSEFFKDFDVLVCPATICEPFSIDALFPREVAGEQFNSYTDWIHLTNALTLVGGPVATIPVGRTAVGLPVGIQIAGPIGSDLLVLSCAAAMEEVFENSFKTPIEPRHHE